MTENTPATKQKTKRKQRSPKPETIRIDHPALGPALGLLDDTTRTRRSTWLSFVWMAIGLLGLVLGNGDIHNGDSLGYLFIFSGFVLVSYGVMELRTAILRRRNPVRMVIGDGGFEFAGWRGTVDWDEISMVGLDIPPKQNEPVGLRVRVVAPSEFAAKHVMTVRAAKKLSAADGWLSIGGGTEMELDHVVSMFRKHLTGASATALSPAPAEAAPIQRRKGRTSRH